MELTLSSNSFQELTKDEMYVVYGGMTFDQARDMASIACAILGIAFAPAFIIGATTTGALLVAAAGGISSMISLIASLY